jgi:glycosyltransferase involved in cell wall biosynthesis
LNSAIRRATGEFICYLASDDYFLPGKLARQVSYLDANPHVAAVFGLPKCVSQSGHDVPFDPIFSIPFQEAEQSRSRWLRRFFFCSNSLAHQTAMIRRSALDKTGLFDGRYWGLPDFDLWVRMCMEFEIRVLPEEFSAFRKLDGAKNISAIRVDSALRDNFEFFQIIKRYKALPSEFLQEIFRDDIDAAGIDLNQPLPMWLAEIAKRGERRGHKLFALELMYEALEGTEGSRRLVELSGTLDPFGIIIEVPVIDPPRVYALPRSTQSTKVRRNDPCPCGSGNRYKHCHGRPEHLR